MLNRTSALSLAFVFVAAAAPARASDDIGADDAPGDAPTATAPEPVVTLDQVLVMAASASPLVAIQDAELRVATLQRLEVRWERFPQLRLDSSISPAPRVELERDPETGELDPFSNRDTDTELLESILGGAGLSVRNELSVGVPITSFGKIRLASQLAQVGIDVAEIEREASVRESQFEAMRAFLTAQWYVEVDRLLREASRRLDDAEEELEWRIDDGDRAARTSLRDLVIARTDFVSLRADADGLGLLARHALATSLGLRTDFRPEPLDEAPPADRVPDLAGVLEYAQDHRADYRLLDRAAQAADLERLLRWRTMVPDLYFGARLNHAWSPTVDDVSGPFVNDPFNRFGFGFLVGLRWNVNPARDAVRARRAEAQAAVVAARTEAAWLGIEIEVTEAWLEASGRRDVLLSYEAALRAAEAALNQVQFQYDQGLVDYDELKDPLETYYRTAAGYYEAILRYRLAVANLALKTGHADLRSWPHAAPVVGE